MARLKSVQQSGLDTPWRLAHLAVPNRVLLAPLAGIGNWCVRLQAKRYGAGMAVSEMVSSFAVHYGNEKTCVEMLRLHPDERATGAGGLAGIVALQLFGQDPDIMRSAAARVRATTDVDVIDLNMGCPVPKVAKTGAGAAMLKDPDTAVAVARAAREGSGLPVTVKLRSGLVPGDTTSGYDLAHRLVEEAGVAAITFHPRSAKVQHKGAPDYDLAARLVESLPAPVILTGGLHTADDVVRAYEHTGAAAVMLARGALGNPWLFSEVLGQRATEPSGDEILAELDWMMDRTAEHLGAARAGRFLRKFYPWYVDRLGGDKSLRSALQQTDDVEAARAVLAASRSVALA